jgi:hypothetical protein
MTHASSLAFPFVYRSGAPFAPRQPESRGLLLGPYAFAGNGVAIDGVIVIAPAHRPVWVWQLWDRDPSVAVELEPLTDEDAHLDVRFTDAERQLVREVLTK